MNFFLKKNVIFFRSSKIIRVIWPKQNNLLRIGLQAALSRHERILCISIPKYSKRTLPWQRLGISFLKRLWLSLHHILLPRITSNIFQLFRYSLLICYSTNLFPIYNCRTRTYNNILIFFTKHSLIKSINPKRSSTKKHPNTNLS